MKTHDKNFIKQYFEERPIQALLEVVGIAVILLNIWLATKLAPLVEGVSVLKTKVEAVEQVQKERGEAYNSIPVIKNDVVNIKENVQEVKDMVREINQKIDAHMFGR